MDSDNKNFEINYPAMIVKHSWWEDVKGRKWLVVDRTLAISGAAPNLSFTPENVTILEELSSEPLVQPWKDIVELVKANKFIEITKRN